MRRSGVAVVAAALLLIVGTAGGTTASTSPAWGVSERIAGGQFAWGMDLGVDSARHVHIVMAGMRNGKAGVFYATDRSGSWVTRRIVPWAAGAVYIHPSLAVDANDRIHVSLDRVQCVECTVSRTLGVFYLTDTGRARGTFGAPVRLTPKGTSQGSLRVAGGHRYLAFAGGWGDTFTNVRLGTDEDGFWSTSLLSAAGADPFLRLSMGGRPRVVFETATGLRYARATSVAGAWDIEPVAGTSGASRDPVLSIDAQNGPHLAWVDTSGPTWKARYARRIDGTWSVTAGLLPSTTVALSVDRPARAWLALGGEEVDVLDGSVGGFSGHTLDGAPATSTAVKVLDSGAVVVAWVGGDGPGLWVAWR